MLKFQKTANDLFWVLALQFVTLMDVLQSISQTSQLLPLDAYEQWETLGSRRAFAYLANLYQWNTA